MLQLVVDVLQRTPTLVTSPVVIAMFDPALDLIGSRLFADPAVGQFSC